MLLGATAATGASTSNTAPTALSLDEVTMMNRGASTSTAVAEELGELFLDAEILFRAYSQVIVFSHSSINMASVPVFVMAFALAPRFKYRLSYWLMRNYK